MQPFLTVLVVPQFGFTLSTAYGLVLNPILACIERTPQEINRHVLVAFMNSTNLHPHHNQSKAENDQNYDDYYYDDDYYYYYYYYYYYDFSIGTNDNILNII